MARHLMVMAHIVETDDIQKTVDEHADTNALLGIKGTGTARSFVLDDMSTPALADLCDLIGADNTAKALRG